MVGNIASWLVWGIGVAPSIIVTVNKINDLISSKDKNSAVQSVLGVAEALFTGLQTLVTAGCIADSIQIGIDIVHVLNKIFGESNTQDTSGKELINEVDSDTLDLYDVIV